MSLEEVRPVINCFCQILSFYGFSKITSEIFILAKYDQTDATIPLWRLIFELIQFDTNPSNQEFIQNKFNQKPKDEIVKLIKEELCKRGYTYENFLSLDNKMNKGSRELLVCLGWLIYHIKFIEKSMKLCLNSINNQDRHDNNEHAKSDLIQQIKQARNTNLKVRSRLQALKNKDFPENKKWSQFESQLLQNPQLISKYLTELEKDHQTFTLFLYWNKNENIFWKWMESVLDQPISENYEFLHDIDYQQLEAEKQKFNAAIDTLDSALIQLEQLWLSNDQRSSIQNDVSSILASIDSEISSLFNQLLNPNSSLKKKLLPK